MRAALRCLRVRARIISVPVNPGRLGPTLTQPLYRRETRTFDPFPRGRLTLDLTQNLTRKL